MACGGRIRAGKPDGATTDKKETLDIWGLDERGSFNAVTAFFAQLGARWYLPGELGEVMPSMKTIPLPKLDETVRPDFPLRQFNFRFSTSGYDTARWLMHLGTRNDDRYLIAHGMDRMTGNDATFAAHPRVVRAVCKRDYTPGDNKNQLCYSNDELFRETVRYTRALLDTYPLKTVSIMPPDGYSAICQCEKCQGKDSPERNERGLASDYVWDFVNRVKRNAADFLALAEGTGSVFQKAAALEQAARLSRKDAEPIIERIPVEAVKKTAQMRHLLAQGKAPEVLAQFANEDFSTWPFWQRGPAYHSRGQAYSITKAGGKAEADLSAALPWVSEPRARDALLLAQAQHRERNLQNHAQALTAYQALVADRPNIGGADEYVALQGIARILTRQGKYDEAMSTLKRANLEKLQGVWRENILKSIAEVESARGR